MKRVDKGLIWERIYPYVFALVAFFAMIGLSRHFKLNLVANDNMNDALDGVITVGSIIIGFVGAIIPVILGMKNDSKVVQYVFNRGGNKLFLTYTKLTLLYGLLLIMVSILLFFRGDIPAIAPRVFYIWFGLIVLFLASTYRSVSNMINLIFTDDLDFSRKRPKSDNEANLVELVRDMNKTNPNHY